MQAVDSGLLIQTAPGSSPLLNRLVLGLGKSLIFWVFALFPILVLQVAFRFAEQQEVEETVKQRDLVHERFLTRVLRLDSEADLVGRTLRRAFQRMLRMSPAQRKPFLSFVEGLFPGAFEAYFFDRAGHRLEELSCATFPRRVSEKVFVAIQQRSKGQTMTPSDEKLLAGLMAIPSIARFAGSQGRTIQLVARDAMGALIWDLAHEKSDGDLGGFLAVIHPGNIARDRALRSSLRFFNQRLTRFQLGMVDFHDDRFAVFPPELSQRADLKSQILTALGNYDRSFQGGGSHGVMASRERGGFLISVAPLPRLFPPGFWTVFNLLCALWAGVILVRVIRNQEVFTGKITARMVGLFLFAVGSPSLVLLFGGFYALRDHSSILMQNLESQVRDKLIQLDQRFPAEIKRIEKNLSQLMVRARGESDLSRRISVFQAMKKEPWCEQLYLVNQKGESLYSLNDMNDPVFRERSKFPLMLCREVLKRINKLYAIDAGSLMIEATAGLFDHLMGSKGKVNIDEIVAQSGQFVYMSMFDEASFFFIDSLENKEGVAENLVLIQVQSARLESLFMKRFLPEFARQPGIPIRVNAVPDRGFMPAVKLFPTDWNRAMDLAQEVRATNSTVRKVLASGTEEVLVIGLRGQNISRFTVVAQTSLEPVKQYISHLWTLLLAMALLVLLSPLVIGMLLSSQILRPLGGLSEGMVAIQNRQFEHRVPVLARDELGEMSSLMNQVIEGMGDLQVARIVQESLFPAGAVELEGFRLYGQSRAMADIGGDYYDFFQVGPSKLSGLIGDVSGHGVSAALIMGMAKCAVTLDESPDRSLVEILGQFNRFLIRTIKRKKMMTGFFFNLDTKTGELTYANAGHNFPYLYRAAGGAISELVMESFPLGVRAKAEYKVAQIVLQPGDTLLLYTDGLVESPGGPLGEGVGYDLTKEWFRQAAHLAPEAILEELLARFDTYTLGRPAADDVSLVCLKRLE